MIASEPLDPTDAPLHDTVVVPRYLRLFAELALEMMGVGAAARVLHLACRTGFPAADLHAAPPAFDIVGIDPSPAAIEVARANASAIGAERFVYRVGDGVPRDLEPESFTHVLALHPLLPVDRRRAFAELVPLIRTGGQALIAVPLRGSFPEVTDLLREYALKFDDIELTKALEVALARRPTIETLSDDLEAAGFDDVDVELRHVLVPFESGAAFASDPIARLLVLPEIRSWFPDSDLARPLDYVREAMERYWSEATLELTVNVGCASARRE
ncbi:MAG TPA: class I SAM-dependent methyltransferase [Polyangiaceae bacterium]|nr:class I SAM-dependent methyltransferase [Polyangiaceae bacterium]